MGKSHSAPDSARPGHDTTALLAAVVTVVLWASAFVGIRSAGRTFSPGALSLGRLLVALVLLAPACLLRRGRMCRGSALRAAFPGLLGCGLLWFGAYNLALNSGERHIDAGTAALVVGVGPILIALGAGLFLREGFPRSLFLGCGVALAGVAVIAVSSSTGHSTAVGVVLCLSAAVVYAGGAVSQKFALRHVDALQAVAMCCAVGVVFFLPFAGELVVQVHSAPPAAIAWVAYLGACPTAVGFFTWAYALKRTDAGRLAATTYAVPPISLFLGWLLLGETPAPLVYVGGAICLAGVALSRRRGPLLISGVVRERLSPQPRQLPREMQ